MPIAAASGCILTVNAGSSSLRLAVFVPATAARRASIAIERVGTAAARLRDQQGRIVPVGAAPEAAIRAGLDAIAPEGPFAAIAHRIVHPGLTLHAHQRLTPPVRTALDAAVALDPTHLPAALALVDACAARFPTATPVACLDTAFHHRLPRPAQLLPLPRRWLERGYRRLGFHGLSYTSLLQQLRDRYGQALAQQRLVLAHLGSGASMAAVAQGEPQDTTMSFTADAGLMMGTRTGDVDPGLLAHLADQERWDGAALGRWCARECGLLGVSGISADMRELLALRATVPAAADAIDLFIHQARRWLGALIAVLGGVDAIVFTGGIGEHVPEIRARILAPMGYAGIALDPERNASHAPEIASDASRVRVFVLATDEEAVMAEIAQDLLAGTAAPSATSTR